MRISRDLWSAFSRVVVRNFYQKGIRFAEVPVTDLNQTRAFLQAIALEADDRAFTFQTFDDAECVQEIEGKPRKVRLNRRDRVRVFHGTLERHAEELVGLNQRGAGVFVTLNRTDGRGRRAENIVAIRAAYTDNDTGEIVPSKITPSIVVQSKRGPQWYWLLEPGEPLDAFRATQSALAHYLKTDPKPIGIPLVVRLPGFLHMKNPKEPFLVKLLKCGSVRYRIEQIRAVYPWLDESPQRDSRIAPLTRNIQPSSQEKRVLAPSKGLSNVFSECDALGAVFEKVRAGKVLGHDEGFSLFHLCMAIEGGIDWFHKTVTGWGNTAADMEQLEHSVSKGYAPWSCRRLQQGGICTYQGGNPCLDEREPGRARSPYAFAFGKKSKMKVAQRSERRRKELHRD